MFLVVCVCSSSQENVVLGFSIVACRALKRDDHTDAEVSCVHFLLYSSLFALLLVLVVLLLQGDTYCTDGDGW